MQPVSTLDDPLALGVEMAVSWDPPGEEGPHVWNLLVGPLREISTDTTPPVGMVFAGFDVEMTLIDIDKDARPLPVQSPIQWEVIGGQSNGVYDNVGAIDHPCGDFSNQLLGPQLFVGGSISGIACVVIPEEDLGHANTVIAAENRQRAYFGEAGTIVSAADAPAVEPVIEITDRDGDRAAPFAFDEAQTIDFAGRGDDVDSIWTVTFSAPEDITEFVIADGAESFNPELRDGVALAGIGVDVTLEAAGVAEKSLSPYVQIEIFGGASGVVYQSRALPNGCGPFTGQFFRGEEIRVGESSSGSMCMQVPVEDIGHPNTRVALTFFDGSRIFFG